MTWYQCHIYMANGRVQTWTLNGRGTTWRDTTVYCDAKLNALLQTHIRFVRSQPPARWTM